VKESNQPETAALPVEVKPLFRPDVLRPRVTAFEFPPRAVQNLDLLRKWHDLLASPQAAALKEQELLRDFLSDVFVTLLGYERPADNPARDTFRTVRPALACLASL
jgi:hypothetical protein